ncbi:MAG: RtcB family protein [Myxococcales bacterium]|nr:RtcB family protein [Myxococcales bacterium]
MSSYELIETENVPIKAWTKGLGIEAGARAQLENAARLPIIFRHVAVMPDVHFGIGATVGSVIQTEGAIIPAAVGVDIGCGMMAVQTDLDAKLLPDSLKDLRLAIEKAVPHGRTAGGGKGDRGAWSKVPAAPGKAWAALEREYKEIVDKHKRVGAGNDVNQLGTLGGGNHFIEVCLDEADQVWFMLHSGSRGVGNRIGTYFIELAKRDMMRTHMKALPDKDLAYLMEGTDHFADYVQAVDWAQRYAMTNRKLMMDAVIKAAHVELPPFSLGELAVNCHHNYVAKEHHFGHDVFVTRKGAVRARRGDLGIIPGSMGARSYIVRGKGEEQSFHSCSHGAGRVMSRGEAKRKFTVEDHKKATEGIECRKDADVIDETPMAYKPIDKVMEAQADLVEVVHELRQVVCVKG